MLFRHGEAVPEPKHRHVRHTPLVLVTLLTIYRLNTFLELKMENERLQQRLRDAKAEAEALDRAEAQRRALSPYVSPHQTPYPGPLHGRAHTAPTSQSFAWTLNSTAGGAGRAFDSRTFYPSFADAVPGSSSSALGAGTSSAHAAAAGEHADPAADPSLPRKKVRLFLRACFAKLTAGAEQEVDGAGYVLLHDVRADGLARVAKGV